MESANPSQAARRQTLVLSAVIGIHVLFAIGLIAATTVRIVTKTHGEIVTRYVVPDVIPDPQQVPPPDVAVTHVIDIETLPPPLVTVAPPTATTTPARDPPTEAGSGGGATAQEVTAAHVARGVNLGELCQAYYPSASRRASEEGSVVVLIYVATSGRVTDSRVETSSGVPRLDEATRRCVTREGRFEPKRVGNDPIGSWQRMKYTWRLAS